MTGSVAVRMLSRKAEASTQANDVECKCAGPFRSGAFLLHKTGRARALSRSSALIPSPLRRRLGWGVIEERDEDRERDVSLFLRREGNRSDPAANETCIH